MKKNILLVIGAIVTLFLLGTLFGRWGFLGRLGSNNWGMMGGNMMGGWGFFPFGWIGMLLIWLIPIVLIALTVYGIAWLVREAGDGNKIVNPVITCSSCDKSVQSDWKNCAYCGILLK